MFNTVRYGHIKRAANVNLLEVRCSRAQNPKHGRPDPWLERLARLGFLAKGAVYLTVGVLAAQAAFGSGGRTTDTQGAVQTISRQPFGQVLARHPQPWGSSATRFWRFMQAALNPANREGAKGVVARAAFVASGVIHVALAVTAVGLLLGSGGGGGGSTEQDITARLLSVPFGRFLVGIGGINRAGGQFVPVRQGVPGRFSGRAQAGRDEPLQNSAGPPAPDAWATLPEAPCSR